MTTHALILAALLVAAVNAQRGVQVSEIVNPAVIAGVLGSLQNPPGGVFTIGGQAGTGLVPNPWAQFFFRPRPCRGPRQSRPGSQGFRGRSGQPTSPVANSTTPATGSTTPATGSNTPATGSTTPAATTAKP